LWIIIAPFLDNESAVLVFYFSVIFNFLYYLINNYALPALVTPSSEKIVEIKSLRNFDPHFLMTVGCIRFDEVMRETRTY
jgi:hypothetical protein